MTESEKNVDYITSDGTWYGGEDSPSTIHFTGGIAQKPKAFFVDSSEKYMDALEIDSDLIAEELIHSGFGTDIVNSYALIFHDVEELKAKNILDRGGWFNRVGYYRLEDAGDGDEFLTRYPLAVHLPLPLSEDLLNENLWHEFGHGHHYLIKHKEPSILYIEKNIEKTRKLGKGLLIGGALIEAGATVPLLAEQANIYVAASSAAIATLGTIMLGTGEYIERKPKQTLWKLDKGERYARKFARKRSHLTPISINI